VLGSSEFAEVFLTDVRVPVANRVGAENDGWRITNVTLKYERGTAFVSELIDSLRLCDELAPRVHDAAQRRELGRCRAEFDALWSLTKRNVSQAARGVTGPGAMVMKLAYSERGSASASSACGCSIATACTSTTTNWSRSACAPGAPDRGGRLADPAQHHLRTSVGHAREPR
jgi:alkylation response protein AidB-like acyl-CoA dehydrogenase